VNHYLLLCASILCASCAAQEVPDVRTEKTTSVPEWDLTLVEVAYCRPESDVCATEIHIEGRGTERKLLASGLTGPFLPLLKSEALFACENNSVMGTKGPALFGLTGTKTELPPHPGYLHDCIAVGTGEEVMLIYNLVESGKPYSLVRIISSDGKVLVERRFDSNGELSFVVSGKQYRARVPTPEWPG
jgi:hypothetical protein